MSEDDTKYTCEECALIISIPFDCGDRVTRCERCAVDHYKKSKYYGVILKPEYCISAINYKGP